MRRRRRPLRACYSVPDLAALMGVSRWTMHRILRARGIPMERHGRVYLVWLESLKNSAPEAFESLMLVRRLA